MLTSGLYIIFLNDTEVLTRTATLTQNSFASSRMSRQIFYLHHLSGDNYAIYGRNKNTIVTYDSSDNTYPVKPIASNPGIEKNKTSMFKITQKGSRGGQKVYEVHNLKNTMPLVLTKITSPRSRVSLFEFRRVGPRQDEVDQLNKRNQKLTDDKKDLKKRNKKLKEDKEDLKKKEKHLKDELDQLRKKCSDDGGLRLFIKGCGDSLAQLRGYMQAGQIQTMYPWLIDLDARVRNFIQRGYRYA
ncbi:hypothetical protein IFM61606_10277 [Aspergillus udagawae]|uniref:Uncharacterized protein n=1 Tax=Aspergillus udagawae TaxID=91492 RepID=A0ABQ1BGY5_9EURO|nr:hypothetical protein IFM61606_10277 [Aspergillus udagawae]GFF63415.1 hypothetical protein IFM51744_11132 [Aspergillus udagawae]GFG01152.1 hypothetical protein IFM53868_10950 [Aspergillus udagawae]